MKKSRWGVLEAVLGGRRRRAGPWELVVGMGNPGEQYAGSRHNLGFRCVDRLARRHGISVSQRHRHVVIGEGAIGETSVALAKPRTFVNNSGQAVVSLLGRYRAAPADLLVIYDDLDLPPGELRLRPRGSAGGHNGMRSIIAAIGTQDFARLRIGIGRPPAGVDEIDYVLETVPPDDREEIDGAVERAVEAAACVLDEGIDAAMNRFN